MLFENDKFLICEVSITSAANLTPSTHTEQRFIDGACSEHVTSQAREKARTKIIFLELERNVRCPVAELSGGLFEGSIQGRMVIKSCF